MTLRRMEGLSVYNKWLHDRFEPWLGNRILEVGSGVGNQTRFFADRERVVASDIEPHYTGELKAKFEIRSNVRIASFRFPLTEADAEDLAAERVDTIVCLNVLEHIEDDAATLRDFARVLPSGGHLTLLVPALPALYGTLDESLRHYRRYGKAALVRLVTEAGFAVEKARFLNRPGVLGWWLNSRVFRRRVLPRQQLGAFRWLMPLLRSEENTEPSFGMSLLVLARKP
jgi:SAM-dependent methyltransferase